MNQLSRKKEEEEKKKLPLYLVGTKFKVSVVCNSISTV
jgi:hypothetical protein